MQLGVEGCREKRGLHRLVSGICKSDVADPYELEYLVGPQAGDPGKEFASSQPQMSIMVLLLRWGDSTISRRFQSQRPWPGVRV